MPQLSTTANTFTSRHWTIHATSQLLRWRLACSWLRDLTTSGHIGQSWVNVRKIGRNWPLDFNGRLRKISLSIPEKLLMIHLHQNLHTSSYSNLCLDIVTQSNQAFSAGKLHQKSSRTFSYSQWSQKGKSRSQKHWLEDNKISVLLHIVTR